MTEKELKEKLHKPYHLDIWQEIVRIIFTRSDFFLSSAYQPLFEGVDFVQKAFQFGVITLADEKRLALVDVQLTDNKVIARNRVELRNLAAKLIDSGQFEGLLVLFHANQQKDYRFSFISKSSTFNDEGELITTQTATKRYSFLLGPNESCTTAARRLMELMGNKNTSTIEAVTNAFSVEKLNKDFFKGYKEHYEKFWHYLKNKTEYYDILKDGEQADTNKTEKPIRDFAKKLLGRIVFLYFLQKKGWMGSPPALDGGVSVWANGDSNFIKNLFQYFPEKQHFYSKCLTQLFFETLNTKRDGHLFTPIGGRGAVLVPYLNGGLFDNDQPHTNHIDFPESYFADLFEFFDQYNFTIDENSPDDANVGIDPEMLGHIFENLLEENKDKGAFYTPKEIVQYMCQEALIQYLKSPLTAAADRSDGGTDVEAIQSFIRNGERGEAKGFIVKNARKIETLLDNVKICDPAIGSGAFPMGMLQEIFKAKMTLDLTLDPADTKRHIIQNSIYGVDLERGAVDIARLRFWLALVVDEETPSPLPNLDYKIMQGNSLLESFEGIDLSKIHQQSVQVFEPQRDLFGNLTQPQMTIFQTQQTQDLQKLIDEYFGVENAERKHSLRKQINQAVHDHIEYNIELRERHLHRRIAEAGKPENMKPKTRKEYDKLVAEQQQVAQSRQNLHALQDRNERPYFLWHLYFKDVFEQGGFDIVIGNPPYIQLQNEGGYLSKLFEGEKFDTFERTGDIYALFYEQGFKCLKNQGVLCYITSNKWMRAGYGESLRKFFAEKTNPITLIDFAGQKIFDNATVDTNILIAQKSVNQGKTKACLVKNRWPDSLHTYVTQHQATCHFQTSDSWVILSPIEQRIREKIEKIGTPLKDWDINIYRGILTGYNEAFIIDGKKKDELIAADPKSAEIIRPILRGRDIKRYGYEFADLWIINTHNGIKEKGTKPIQINDYPAIKKYLDTFYPELEKRTDKGETPYNLRNCAYMDDFFNEKIIYPEITKFLNFYYDEKAFMTNNKCFIITGDHIAYLTAFFNSSLFKYCYRDSLNLAR
ncbi:Eco57I restriction-modification methylase domain-containing protein [Runella limosa]|uniref:Eco57I restriction-modification methylase domain-containing protein n=1 Tax=Runella limosa TaxID=370978 RepID=UPI000427BFFA|nr:Eco57I restriction-modification methylase domain-containing protein [Runella limosa]